MYLHSYTEVYVQTEMHTHSDACMSALFAQLYPQLLVACRCTMRYE